jgi:mono/diheme cytochrome c family protein
MTRTQNRLRNILIALFVLALAGTGFYFTFRYTLIADVRESLSSAADQAPVDYGRTLFSTRGCAGCHTLETIGAVGDEGPNLTGIASRADADYIRESILEPNAVIATGCPDGPCESGVMPGNYGRILDDAQLDALMTFLLEQE